MAHRTSGHVVELVGDVGIEPTVAGEVRRLIEVGADLAGAIDRGEAETGCSADIGHVRRREHHAAYRRAECLDGGGAGLGAAPPDEGVDHGEAVGFDHDSGVGHPSPGRLAQPHRYSGRHALQHPNHLLREAPRVDHMALVPAGGPYELLWSTSLCDGAGTRIFRGDCRSVTLSGASG